MFPVGVGLYVEESDMRELAPPPQIENINYFYQPSASSLGETVAPLLLSVCDEPADNPGGDPPVFGDS